MKESRKRELGQAPQATAKTQKIAPEKSLEELETQIQALFKEKNMQKS